MSASVPGVWGANEMNRSTSASPRIAVPLAPEPEYEMPSRYWPAPGLQDGSDRSFGRSRSRRSGSLSVFGYDRPDIFIAVHCAIIPKSFDLLPDDYRFETVSFYRRALSRDPHKKLMTL